MCNMDRLIVFAAVLLMSALVIGSIAMYTQSAARDHTTPDRSHVTTRELLRLAAHH